MLLVYFISLLPYSFFPCPSSAGIPPHADYAKMELSAVYNVCICFIAQFQFAEVESLLTQATKRGGPLPKIMV